MTATVAHPDWCAAGDCMVTTAHADEDTVVVEAVHAVGVHEMQLELVRPGRSQRAVVAQVQFEEFGLDGAMTRSDAPVVVLDTSEGVISLTADEAVELGLALARAGLRIAHPAHPAGKPGGQR